MDRFYADHDAERLHVAERKLTSAVHLISAIASGDGDGCAGDLHLRAQCDAWLESNGYDCEATRKRNRERRADELDKEIARLRAEREKL
jgi:hypothetical protein